MRSRVSGRIACRASFRSARDAVETSTFASAATSRIVAERAGGFAAWESLTLVSIPDVSVEMLERPRGAEPMRHKALYGCSATSGMVYRDERPLGNELLAPMASSTWIGPIT